MSTLVVLGAGDLGGAVARHAAAGAITTRVAIVDDAADVACGKALDISQAGALDGVSVEVVGTSDPGVVVGASAIVLADRHGPPAVEWQGDEGLRRLMAVRALNPRALIICAGAAQLDLIERMVAERGADAAMLAGSSPEAWRSGITAVTSLESRTAPRDISLMVLGRPPRRAFVAWGDASIAGCRATDVLDAPALTRLDARVPYLWPPGPLALAAAAVRVVSLALANAPGWPSVFVVPALDGPIHSRGVALPVSFTGGRVTPRWPTLSPRDRVRLQSAMSD